MKVEQIRFDGAAKQIRQKAARPKWIYINNHAQPDIKTDHQWTTTTFSDWILKVTQGAIVMKETPIIEGYTRK